MRCCWACLSYLRQCWHRQTGRKMKASALLVLALATCSVSGEMTWERLSEVSNMSPAPRSRHAMGFCNSTQELIVFSGRTSSGLSSETWIYNMSGGVWSMWSDGTSGDDPPARMDSFHGVIQAMDIFVVAQGIGSNGTEYGDVWVFHCRRRTWIEITDLINGTGPSIRYGGHFGSYFSKDDNSLWLGSGFTKTTGLYPSRYIDTYKLTFSAFNNAAWETLHRNPSSGNQFNPLVPHGRCLQGSAVVSQSQMVMYGGCLRANGGSGGGPCPSEDVWTFDATSSWWTQLDNCPTPRVWSQMAPLTNRPGAAVLYGGTEKMFPQLIYVVDYPIDEVFVVEVNQSSGQQWMRLHVRGKTGAVPGRRFRHAMAAGPDGRVFMFGGENVDSANFYYGDLWELSGEVNATQVYNCDRIWFSYAHLHGLMMALAWGILLPLGFLVARYYRFCGKVWFIIHVTLQITGVLLTITAFVLIFPATSPTPSHPHAIIGLLLMLLTLQQPINGILRPHVKKDVLPTKRRICWEWFHRIMGIPTLVVGFLQVTLGIFLIVSPLGVWVFWILLLCAWVGVYATHETIKWILFFLKKKKREKDPTMQSQEMQPKY